MRIKTHKGVKGIIISNYAGVSIKSTLSTAETSKYSSLISSLTLTAKSTIKELDSQNDLVFLRIRSRKYEIMIAPDQEYILIVIQNPDEE
jgi:dynein light chain roadblock-type